MVTNMQNKNEANAFARVAREVVAHVDAAMLAGIAVKRAHRAHLKANDAAAIAKWLRECNGGTDNGEHAKAQEAWFNCEERCIAEERRFRDACKTLRDAINGDAVRRAVVYRLLATEAEVSPVHCQVSWLIDLG
jgi:hypothetical protein